MAVKEYRVTAESLNVRNAPSITGDVVGHLKKNDMVKSADVSGDGYWLKITKGSLKGWASHKYLSLKVENPPLDNIAFPWMPIALAEAGVKEYPGNGDNPRIVEFLRSTNLSAPQNANDETPWCSAFVNWCVERAGYEGTDSAWARSWLNWGKKLGAPQTGCIVVLERGKQFGHVGFYVKDAGANIEIFGGNQDNEVGTNEYPKSRLLGYRTMG